MRKNDILWLYGVYVNNRGAQRRIFLNLMCLAFRQMPEESAAQENDLNLNKVFY